MKTLSTPDQRSGSLQPPKEPTDFSETRLLRKETATVLATRSSTAFTLFELLVAMSVIAIIAAVTFAKVDLRIFHDSPTAGIRTLSDLMRVARTQAILNGAPARLIINYDESDIDRFLRYAGVVVADYAEDGLSIDAWLPVDRGVYLPPGVYVVPADTTGVDLSNWSTDTVLRRSEYRMSNTDPTPAVFNLAYPTSGSDSPWIFLQFGPNGQTKAAEGGPAPQGNYLIVGRAAYRGDQLSFVDGEAAKGVGLKKSGALFSIDDVDHYENPDG